MLPKKVGISKIPAINFWIARYEHNFSQKKFLRNLKKKQKETFLGRFWAKIGVRKTQPNKGLIQSGEIPSPRQRSKDKTNDCVINSERGALVRGSDPPFGHGVHKTTGDRWRAPARRQASDTNTFGRCCVKNRREKFSIPLWWRKIDIFQVWEKSVGRRRQLLTP